MHAMSLTSSYFDEIKHPMDFGTIGQRIDRSTYKTMGEFARDVELVFAKCVVLRNLCS